MDVVLLIDMIDVPILPFVFSRCGKAASIIVYVPIISVWNAVCQLSAVFYIIQIVSSIPTNTIDLTPATQLTSFDKLLTFATTTSILLLSLAQSFTHCASLSLFVTSTTFPIALASGTSWTYLSFAALTSCAVREQKCTVAPSFRKPWTIERPMPLVPPECNDQPLVRSLFPHSRMLGHQSFCYYCSCEGLYGVVGV